MSEKLNLPAWEPWKTQRGPLVTPKGGTHKSKKAYNRKRDKDALRKENSERF